MNLRGEGSVGAAARDGSVVAALVALTAVAYLLGLGFYSDDWDFLSMLVHAEDQSILGLTLQQMTENPNLALRPTQSLYSAVLFRLFGADPVGYHMVNTAMLAGFGALLCILARWMGAPRHVAFPLAVLALVLPNAATNRFWFASFFYNLTLVLAAGSVLADLRCLSARGARAVAWKVAALLLLLAAALGAEVVLPVLAMTPIGMWSMVRRRWAGGLSGQFGRVGGASLLLGNYVVLAGVVWYKSRFDSQGVAEPGHDRRGRRQWTLGRLWRPWAAAAARSRVGDSPRRPARRLARRARRRCLRVVSLAPPASRTRPMAGDT